jgi:release factor glutamine methyltransferase
LNFPHQIYVGGVTVLEVIQRSTEFLTRKGVDSPRLQIELLLAHVLQMPRLKLYLNFERLLTEGEAQTVRDLVKRRGDREPLQHLVGSTSFHGYEIAVNRNVLVPRPETELLAEHAWNFLSTLDPGPSHVLDFGTGSGCLAIALAARSPTALVHAVDVSEAAVAVARENAARHGVSGRIQFHLGDGFSPLAPDLRFDLIVANPPYIARAEIESLQPEVRDFDPRVALDGGEDGLDFFRRLAAEAGARLGHSGRLMMEFGDGQEAALSNLFRSPQWSIDLIAQDNGGRPRILIARAAV